VTGSASPPSPEAIAALARYLPPATATSLCDTLESLDVGIDSATVLFETRGFVDAEKAEPWRDIVNGWCNSHPGEGFGGLAYALRSAKAVDSWWRNHRKLELIWTGPAPANKRMRRTVQALIDVIDRANTDLWVVTFCAYTPPEVKGALRRAKERGARVRLVLESRADCPYENLGGVADDLDDQMRDLCEVYIWPRQKREDFSGEPGRVGSLHPKCAVADGKTLFISSANLTGKAYRENMELGMLVTGGNIPRQVSEQLAWLLRGGTLQPFNPAS